MRWIALLLILAFANCALADVVVLKDGTRYEGALKRDGNHWRITTSDGKEIVVAIENVKSLELAGPNSAKAPTTQTSTTKGSTTRSSVDQASSNLASLRRSVENVPDLKQVIDRFKHFIEQYKDTPAAVEAQKDLAIWQDRLERGLVKLAGKWVTPAERTEMADKALETVGQARELVGLGRLHDGDLLLQQALELDPQCVPALYLHGVVLYEQRQLAPARKMFEGVATLITDHAPTLNNLAVILWQQNAHVPALAQYEQAMTASPVNRAILDNVAEALAALADDTRKNIVAQRVYRKFTEQDTRLREAMAARGLYRWGGTWIDKPAMEKLEQQEKEVGEKVKAAQAELDGARLQVQSIDDQINQIDASLAQIRNDSVTIDPSGKPVRYPYPPMYFDLLNQETKLKADRDAVIVKGTAAQSRVKSLQAEMPKPKFSGIQQIIGAEGVPQMMPPGAAAPPTTTSPTNPDENQIPADAIPAPKWPTTEPGR